MVNAESTETQSSRRRVKSYSKTLLGQGIDNLFTRLEMDLRSPDHELNVNDSSGNSLARYQTVYLEVLERQRALLDEMNQSADFDEDLIRKYLSLIDMEEFKLREERLTNGES